MTTSTHDAEALNAIRKSNELLRESQSTWADIIARSPVDPTPVIDPTPDLFDDEPLLRSSPADGVSAAKDAARARIRSVPEIWRILFFPMWAFAESYVTSVYKEPWPIKAI